MRVRRSAMGESGPRKFMARAWVVCVGERVLQAEQWWTRCGPIYAKLGVTAQTCGCRINLRLQHQRVRFQPRSEVPTTPEFGDVAEMGAQLSSRHTCMERRQGIGGSCTASPQQLWLQPQWTHKDTNAAIHCLSNRSIWVLGNSVTRHWAFILAAILLDGVTHPRQMSSTSREMEKKEAAVVVAHGW